MGTDGFSRIDTVAGPEDALRALIEKRADVALSWSPVEATAADGMEPRGPLARLIARKVAGADTLKVLWSSDPVPNGPHVVRSGLPQDMRVKLRDFLINLKSDDAEAYEAIEPDFGGGFVPVSKDAFNDLVKVLGGR
jgi:phosphonate transport system substrate-binding protein